MLSTLAVVPTWAVTPRATTELHLATIGIVDLCRDFLVALAVVMLPRRRANMIGLNDTVYRSALTAHYATSWGAPRDEIAVARTPNDDELEQLRILVWPPRTAQNLWTYATNGMSCGIPERQIELHLFSPIESALHLETLASVAHYHRYGARLDLGHTVNFGRPWLKDSTCSFGLISLPYTEGPSLERCNSLAETIACFWLIPITEQERDFKKTHGLEALEKRFESASLDYADPRRASVA